MSRRQLPPKTRSNKSQDRLRSEGAEFLVLGNGKVLWRSGIMKRGMPAKECNILLDSMQFCELLVFNGDDNIYSDHANWADAYFIMNKNSIPKPYKRIIDSAIILTP